MSLLKPLLVSAILPLSLTALSERGYSQTQVPAPGEHARESDIISLDRLVISAGADPRSAFDIAQGTSIVSGAQLAQQVQGTLGETLASTPGVTSTYYGPGSSRPIIRGLGGDRIRVLTAGVGALDASSVSPDHNTAVEPLFARSIEVVRGPSTLLYGSSAIGGVVNIFDNSIPSEPGSAARLEARGGGPGRERAGVASLRIGRDAWAIGVNGMRQVARDVHIPGVARIDAAAPSGQPSGTLPNSFVRTKSGSIGASRIGNAGHLGAAVSAYSTEYGVPVDEPISIAMQQRRFDFEGELRRDAGLIRTLKARGGFGNYRHREIADRTTTNTTFRNRAWEGRVDAGHALPGGVTGTLGAQASRSDFEAAGAEVATPPSRTDNQAVFALEEAKRGRWTVQFGGRAERQSIQLGEVDPSLPAVPGYSAFSGQRIEKTAFSGSAGTIFRPAPDWSVALSYAYSERMPTAQERFSNGPHGGTGAYEIGTSGLAKERSNGLDLIVRRRSGMVTGSAGLFLNRFTNYIFEQELPAGAIPAASNPDGLTPYQFVSKRAEFRGGEIDVTFHLFESDLSDFHVELRADWVRAEQLTDRQPLPRIPAVRFGGTLHYETGPWSVELDLRHNARQGRVDPAETPTAASTLVNANASYHFRTEHWEYELFARGTNLGDAEAREHTSFLKEFAPLPGRGLLLGVRMNY